MQKKSLEKIFGRGVEFNLLDMAGEIAKEIPGIAGKSLLRIKSLSRIARYEEGPTTELDVFINLFISFVHKREKIHGDADTRPLQLVAPGHHGRPMPLPMKIASWYEMALLPSRPTRARGWPNSFSSWVWPGAASLRVRYPGRYALP